MKKLLDEITFIAKNLTGKKILRKFLVLLFGVPIILIISQYLFRYLIVSQNYEQITLSYLRLNTTEPTFPAMFFSNYLHDPFVSQHLMNNCLGYVFFLTLNFFIYFMIIPILKRRNVLRFQYPDSAFFLTSVVFLIALPFPISGISIIFGRMLGFEGVLGFSGIVWAFTAYFIFLILIIISDLINRSSSFRTHQDTAEQITSQDSEKNPNDSAVLIFFNSFVIIISLFLILLDLENNKINAFGHLAGFTIGLMISPLIFTITQTQIRKQRIVLAGLCGLIIFIPSVVWVFI